MRNAIGAGEMKFVKVILFLALLSLVATGQSANVSKSGNTSKLTGTLYDANGSVVAGEKVTAIGKNGEKFEAVSGEDGVYILTLLFSKYGGDVGFQESKYDIVVDSHLGFMRSETKGYVFIPSQFGKMHLDIALEAPKRHHSIQFDIK